ncbi:MAG TPA: hypothetical protein VIM18_08130, partial [Solirubrobacteraceae bacterium]
MNKTTTQEPTATRTLTTAARRAIGIVRVSETAGREGERFHSPDIQREHIQRDCEQHDLAIAEIIEELDVSGG